MSETKPGVIQTAISGALSALLIAIFASFFWGIPVKVIWNALLIQLVPIAAISYWQAVCAVLVFKLITSPIKRGQ